MDASVRNGRMRYVDDCLNVSVPKHLFKSAPQNIHAFVLVLVRLKNFHGTRALRRPKV